MRACACVLVCLFACVCVYVGHCSRHMRYFAALAPCSIFVRLYNVFSYYRICSLTVEYVLFTEHRVATRHMRTHEPRAPCTIVRRPYNVSSHCKTCPLTIEHTHLAPYSADRTLLNLGPASDMRHACVQATSGMRAPSALS